MAQYIQKQTKKQNPAYQVQEDVDFVKSNKIPPGNTWLCLGKLNWIREIWARGV